MNGARSYRVSELLGRGSFGAVYRAEAVGAGIERPVAIKVLRSEQASVPGLLARLRDEARMLALIRHRAIVRVDDLVELDGHWSIVMEYVEGCDVGALLRDGPLPPRVALAVAEEVANALHAAATQEGPDGRPLRLVHRDVKPANIRVTAQGEVKLLDFGVARADFSARESGGTNGVFGTPTYMAPERFAGHDSHGSDVYALGVSLFEMLAGEPPGASPMEPDRVPPGIRLAPAWRAIRETSRPLADLLCAMLAPDPSERPSARDCARALSRIRGQLGGMTLEDWAERVVPPAVRARRPGEDGRVGTVMCERSSQESLRVPGKPPRRALAAWVAAAGGAVAVSVAIAALVTAGGAWWWWSVRRDAADVVSEPAGDGRLAGADADGGVGGPAGGGSGAAGGVTVERGAGVADGGAAVGPGAAADGGGSVGTVAGAEGGGPVETGAGAEGGGPVGSGAAGIGVGAALTGTGEAVVGTGVGGAGSGAGTVGAGKGAGATTSGGVGASAAPSGASRARVVRRPTEAGASSSGGAGTEGETPPSTRKRTAPSTGIVALAGAAESVMLMGNGTAYGAGEVPVGEYAAEVTLAEGEPYTLRMVTVKPGRVTTIACDARYCRDTTE